MFIQLTRLSLILRNCGCKSNSPNVALLRCRQHFRTTAACFDRKSAARNLTPKEGSVRCSPQGRPSVPTGARRSPRTALASKEQSVQSGKRRGLIERCHRKSPSAHHPASHRRLWCSISRCAPIPKRTGLASRSERKPRLIEPRQILVRAPNQLEAAVSCCINDEKACSRDISLAAMSSSGPAAESQSVSHYLHPDFLEPLPSALDPKQNPLVLLAQTCNNIGKDVSYSNAKKLAAKAASGGANNTASAAAEARLSPPKLVALKSDEDKVPSSTCLEQRHSPTSTRSPKYAVTPEQAKSADGKALSPGQHLKEGARVVAGSPHREDKAASGYPSPRSSGHGHLSGASPIASAAAAAVAAAAAAAAAAASSRDKATPPTAGDAKSPAASQDLSGGALASGSSNFPFPIHHPALLSAYPGMPWPTFPFPHLPSLPGLACPCGQCASGLGSPGAAAAAGAAAAGTGTAAASGCTAAGGCSPCSCAHCLSGAASGQHSFLPDSFSSACFYSGLLNSYLGAQVHGGNGHSKSAAVAAAAAAAAAAAVPPPASSSVATSSTAPPAVSSASSSSTAPSRTVEYCMYCGKHCPSPEQLLAHLQTHMSASPESTISPPVSASLPAPAAAPPGLGLYSSSAAADLLRKLYASSATSPTPAAGLSPRFHPYRSFLPKLSPHRAPYQPFGAPLV